MAADTPSAGGIESRALALGPSRGGAVAEGHERHWSGGQLVLVDEPSKEVAAADRPRGSGNRRRMRRLEAKAAMGPSAVVMADVLVEDPFQVTTGEYE